MPPDLGTTFALSDLLTILGIVIGLAVQSWGFQRWLTKQFDERDDAIAAATRERNQMIDALRTQGNTAREQTRNEIARVDRDVAILRSEVRERLAVIPSRKDLDDALRDRVSPLESDLRALTIELARIGVHQPVPRRVDS